MGVSGYPVLELAPGAYERRWVQATVDGGEDVIGPKGTIVLEPTAAQLAAGVRMLAVDETSCGPAKSLRAVAMGAGWSTLLTRSRFLSAVAVQGGRKGRRHEIETIALRMWMIDPAIVAYATWHFDVERGRWAFESAASAIVRSWAPRVIDPPVGWGAAEIAAIVKAQGGVRE